MTSPSSRRQQASCPGWAAPQERAILDEMGGEITDATRRLIAAKAEIRAAEGRIAERLAALPPEARSDTVAA